MEADVAKRNDDSSGAWSFGFGALLLPIKPLALRWFKWSASLAQSHPKLGMALGAARVLGQRYVDACQADDLSQAQSLRARHELGAWDARALGRAGPRCRSWLAAFADPRSRDALGLSPLMVAATTWGEPAGAGLVRFSPRDLGDLRLLAQAAQGVIDQADSQGKSAFALLAMRAAQADPLRVLFDAGANPMFEDPQGVKAIEELAAPAQRSVLAEVASWARRLA